ncbi:hypothetical protein Tco_1095466 [Tanacetum coccineum]
MSPSPFGTPNTSSASATSTTTPGFGETGPSPFGNSTPTFGTRTFGTPNTSSSGTSTSTHGFGATMPPSPFGTPNTSASGTSTTTPGFGARTSPSPFDTSNTSTSVFGITPCFGAITLPSPFGSESSMGMFSSTPLSTSSMGFNHITSSFSTSSQSAQPTQSPVSSHLVETTGGTEKPIKRLY